MSRYVLTRSAFGRSLIVAAISAAALIASAATSSASTAADVASANSPAQGTAPDETLGLTASHTSVLLGMSVGTVAWVCIGLALLIVGFVSAATPGRRIHKNARSAAAAAGQPSSAATASVTSQGDLMGTLAVS